MKASVRVSIALAVILAVILFVTVMRMNNKIVSTAFAAEITLRREYEDVNINVAVTDEEDKAALKDLLSGRLFEDSPSCGFGSTAVTLSDGTESLTVYPAGDSCPLVRVEESDYYIELKDRPALDAILAKYGIYFPCV